MLAAPDLVLGFASVLEANPNPSSSSGRLSTYIENLECAFILDPHSADICTCLGMAYAAKLDFHRSIEYLERARRIDKNHFFAQFRYAELVSRLHALPRAEKEARHALRLACSGWQFAMAHRQLKDIRRRMRSESSFARWLRKLPI